MSSNEASFVQLLAADGTCSGAAPPEATLRDLYTQMSVTRAIDTEATGLQRQGELALWASCRGQEAAQIGAVSALRNTDVIFPTYRDHGVLHARGLDITRMLELFRGVNFGAWSLQDNGVYTYTIVLAAQLLHAVGYAWGAKREGKDTVVLAMLGDGATSEGEFHDACVWAASFSVPVVFLCQNNQYAISVPVERQSHTPLYQRAAGYGFPGVQVDGNDVIGVRATIAKAASRARRGEGPTLVEAYTYRTGAHTTSDDPTRYRAAEEVAEWEKRDPIARLELYLRDTCKVPDEFFEEARTAASSAATETRRICLSLSPPPISELFTHVTAVEDADRDRQRQRVLGEQVLGGHQ